MIPGNAGRNAIVYNRGHTGILPTDPSMLSFLRLLKQRHDCVLQHSERPPDTRHQTLRRNIKTLAFAEAALEKTALIRQQPHHPLNIAVLGPTQAGKSSIINWLLRSPVAKVSPLAGYTVHPQAFRLTPDSASEPLLNDYMRHYQRLPRDELAHDRLGCYSLDAITSDHPIPALENAILWDTPDFDSVESGDYLDAVLRVAALADIVILTVSKDKYADLTVWDVMRLLEPLGQPVLTVINKLDPATATTLIDSFRDKWRTYRRDSPTAIVGLPFQPNGMGLTGMDAERETLLTHLLKSRHTNHRQHLARHNRQLIDQHWDDWTQAIRSEHLLQQAWSTRVEEAVEESIERYQRDFLDHPQHYETFQRALAELLTLLDIPGIGGALQAARRAVTWPIRQLTRLGQRAASHTTQGEAAILHQLADHVLIRLAETLLLDTDPEPLSRAWWNELAGTLRQQRSDLLKNFDSRTATYLTDFQPEIENTARHLYQQLEEHPVVLNSLRATRVTTDAAALAMALHTGGIGVQDFVIAPAMLSLTTLLAESALGRYMNKAARQLKQRQKDAVTALFRQEMRLPLLRLPDQLNPDKRFGIAPETLMAAKHSRG